MKTLMFEGHSDDTFGELTTGEDHDNCANNAPIIFKVLSLSAGAGVKKSSETGGSSGSGCAHESSPAAAAAIPNLRLRTGQLPKIVAAKPLLHVGLDRRGRKRT